MPGAARASARRRRGSPRPPARHRRPATPARPGRAAPGRWGGPRPGGGRFVEHLDRGPVALWGWSQGAMTAQELALARPDLVRCAVMMATRGRLSAYDRYRYRVEQEMQGDGARLFAILQNYPAGM